MEYIEAAIKLAIPVMMMSWWVHSWLVRNGLVDPKSSQKETEEAVKNIRKSDEQASSDTGDFWTRRWLKFGGGFYGLTALWTFVVIEIKDFFWLITHPQQAIELLSSGFVNVLVAFLQNQAMNFVQAFTWIVNWSGHGFSLIWFFAAYGGFYVGMKLAKEKDVIEAYNQIKEKHTMGS